MGGGVSKRLGLIVRPEEVPDEVDGRGCDEAGSSDQHLPGCDESSDATDPQKNDDTKSAHGAFVLEEVRDEEEQSDGHIGHKALDAVAGVGSPVFLTHDVPRWKVRFRRQKARWQRPVATNPLGSVAVGSLGGRATSRHPRERGQEGWQEGSRGRFCWVAKNAWKLVGG